MKKLALVLAAILTMAAPMASMAMEHDHGGHHDGMTRVAGIAHEKVVDGVKATFTVQTMADAMESMGMEMPQGVKETHHVSVVFKDAKSGKVLTDGEVVLKVQNPDKTGQTKEMMGMHGHFGADFSMASKGRYGIMCKFKVKDGKVRQSRFWYTVK